ncbi:MAG: cupredoxin domain-containing protein [Solirubrobacteraceae bacterium]|nr:cupredoxin domain-containing protein [Solirubrobacteraceae bacterium]
MSACGADDVGSNADLIAGKQAFVEKCGSCHVLARADTKGIAGPDLDEAFRQSINDGLGRGTIHGVVREQILYPAILPPDHPGYMPADLVTGKLASDVAAYVATVAALPGEDAGKLGSAVAAAGDGEPVAAEDGVLALPADPGGQLAYITKVATAPPGPLEITSENESSVPHDIAIEGNGVDERGEVVQDGGVSRVDVTLAAGEYAFYCTVAGHREGGMEGTLTVE